MTKLMLSLLRFYQRWLSPMLPPRCRFQPTCSSYFKEALETHGFLKGSALGVSRLLKCHPLHPGGYDPCPGHQASDIHTTDRVDAGQPGNPRS